MKTDIKMHKDFFLNQILVFIWYLIQNAEYKN